MPFKLNNTYIVERIEDIPVNDLPIGRQVMLVEQHQDRESQKMVDKTTHMTLESIEMRHLFRFWANIITPVIQIDEKKFQGIQDELGEDTCGDMSEEAFAELCVQTSTTDILADTDMNHVEMMMLDGKLIHLQVDENGTFDIKRAGYSEEYGGKKNIKVSTLWEKIFNWSINYDCIHGTHTEQNIFTQFMSVPIEKGKVAIVFVINHNVKPASRYWNTGQCVYLMNKEGDVTEIKASFKYMYRKVKETRIGRNFDKDFEKFDEIIQAHDYDIRQFIEDNGSGLYKVKSVFAAQNAYEIYSSLDKFYSPYFVYDGVSVYPNSIRGRSGSPRLVVDGKDVGWRSEQKYPEQYRVGQAFAEFYKHGKSGIDPETGEIVNHNYLSRIYGDDEGLILLSSASWSKSEIYYIKKLGYFVPANLSLDEVEIKDLKERRELMNHMKSLQPITQAV